MRCAILGVISVQGSRRINPTSGGFSEKRTALRQATSLIIRKNTVFLLTIHCALTKKSLQGITGIFRE